MATVSLTLVNGAQTVTGTLTISSANATRLVNAEKIRYATDAQGAFDELIRRFLDEMIGDTKTIERNATPIADFTIT
jgi:hypothetical protein